MTAPPIERYYVTSTLLLVYFNHGISECYDQNKLSLLK